MKEILKSADKAILEKSVKETELKTGAQIVLAVVKRSDHYPEIPWKAFAVGASLSALIVLILQYFYPGWPTGMTILFTAGAILSTGIFFSILTVILPFFAVLFLSNQWKETETCQYAESLFLSRELFATHERKGILLLVSVFERRVVIMPDIGVRKQLSETVIKEILISMKPCLKQNRIKDALETGLSRIAEALGDNFSKSGDINEISDKIIEEEGV